MYIIRNLLRYGIGTKCRMESLRSDVWHQSEGRYTLARDAMPSQIDGFHSPHFARRLHTNPSDWIEKSKSCDLLFSGGEGEIRTLEPLLTVTRFPVVRPRPTRRLLHEYCRHYRADSYMIPQKEEFVKGFLKKILKFCKKRAEGGNQLKQP